MFSDRAQAIAEVIEPALQSRQHCAVRPLHRLQRGLPGGRAATGQRGGARSSCRLVRGLQPDLTLLLLPDFDLSLQRARRRNQRAVAATGKDENRFESESSAFYRRVFDKYQEIAAREPLRVVAIDSNGSIDEVHERVVEVVRGRL